MSHHPQTRGERIVAKRAHHGDDSAKGFRSRVNQYERRKFGRRLLAKLDKRKALGERRPL